MTKRIYTKLVFQMTDDPAVLIELERTEFDYSGPIAECKGGASKAEQAAADQQRAMQNQLMQNQLAMQQKQIDMVNPTLQSIISNGGLLPAQQNALTAQYMNMLPQTINQGMSQINQNLVARGMTGGSNAGSGGVAGNYGALTAMLGSLQQQGATNVEMAKMQGLNNAMNTTLGIGGMYGNNVGTFNSGASNALNSGVTAAHNVDQASSSIYGPLIGAAAGLGGSAITKWCWIARELYGSWTDPRLLFIRERLEQRSRKQLTFAVIVVAYRLLGRQLACLVRVSNTARHVAATIFDGFLMNEMDFVLNEAVHNMCDAL